MRLDPILCNFPLKDVCSLTMIKMSGKGGGGENFMKLSYFSLILSYDPADFIFLFLLGEQ